MAFENVKNPLQKKSFISLLRFAATAALTAPGTAVAPTDRVDKLIAADPTLITKVSVDPTNAAMSIIQITTAGQTAAAALPAEEPVAAKADPITYQMVELDEVPESKRGGNKGDSYPFADLAAPKPVMDPANPTVQLVVDGVAKFKYASFFVPSTDKRQNPAKSLQSTASSATKRYTDSGDKRTFTARKATDTTGKVIGAHVIRIA